MAYGLNAATGKYFCIWCYCTKAKICDFSNKSASNILNYGLKDKFCRQYKYKMQCLFGIFLIKILLFNFFLVQDWPIERNLQQCMKNSAEKTTDGRKGSIHEPLISIPFTQVIVDTLHLFLRIMGLLFHQVNTHFHINTNELVKSNLTHNNGPFLDTT